MHILIVEDNPVNQKLLSLMLKQFGHTFQVAENGEIGVAMFRQDTYDLVLMDIQMPEMNGFEATSAIRELEKQSGKYTPIIAVTAHAMPGYKEKCLAGGMDNYIAKPFKIQDMMDIIEQTFAQTKAVP